MSTKNVHLYLCVFWNRNRVISVTQLPQLVGTHVVFCSQWMVVPSTAKCIQIILQLRKKDVMAAKEVCSIWNVKKALFLKVVKNIVVNACNGHPEVSPQSLYSEIIYKKYLIRYGLSLVCMRNSLLVSNPTWNVCMTTVIIHYQGM